MNPKGLQRRNCRSCGRFTAYDKKHGHFPYHCNRKCYGFAQRGKSRDRQTPSVKEYIQIRGEGGKREYLHRLNYKEAHNLTEIPEGMVVHHKTENKRINAPEHLGLMSRNEHTPHAHYHWRVRDWQDSDYREVEPDAINEFEDLGW